MTEQRPRKGILVVHGIGSQPESDTLLLIGAPLLRWIKRASVKHGYAVNYEETHLRFRPTDDGQGGAPAHTTLTMTPACGPAETWVLAEAWWAGSIQQPEIPLLAAWLRRQVGTAILAQFRAQVRRWRHLNYQSAFDQRVPVEEVRGAGIGVVDAAPATAKVPWWASVVERTNATWLVLVAGVVAALNALGALATAVFLAPIPVLGSLAFFRALRTFAAARLGDFYLIVVDPVQGANIRCRIEDQVIWLVEAMGCQEITIVAHSGGAVAAFDALCYPRLRAACPAGSSETYVGRVRALCTLGSGFNKALGFTATEAVRGQEQPLALRDRFPAHVGWLDFWATHDPIPAGSLDDATMTARRTSIEVTHRHDLITDHGGYWYNSEEVLARIAQAIDTGVGAGGDRTTDSRFWPDGRRLGGDEDDAARQVRREQRAEAIGHRRKRVAIYVAATLLLGQGGLIALAAAWPGLQSAGARIAELLDRIPVVTTVVQLVAGLAGPASAIERAAQYLLGVAVVLIPFLLCHRIFLLAWDGYDRAVRFQMLIVDKPLPGRLWWGDGARSLLGRAIGYALLLAVIAGLLAGLWWWLVLPLDAGAAWRGGIAGLSVPSALLFLHYAVLRTLLGRPN